MYLSHVEKTKQVAMKTLPFFFFLLLCPVLINVVMAAEDDCPCRKKPVIKVVKIVKVKPAPVKLYDKYELYPGGINPPPPLVECPNQRAVHQRDEMHVKILPNPTMEILNLVYTIEETAPVKIELLACDGHLIETLMHKTMRGGTSHSSFNILGKVRPGAAYIRFTSGIITKVEKIMIL